MKEPPYSYGAGPVRACERRDWYATQLVGRDGRPTSELGAELVRTFFRNPGKSFELEELADELFLDPRQLLVLLRQLVVFNVVDERAGDELRFQRVRRPWNRSLVDRIQVWFEADRSSRFTLEPAA